MGKRTWPILYRSAAPWPQSWVKSVDTIRHTGAGTLWRGGTTNQPATGAHQFSSVEGSRREPRRHASMGTPEGCFGADDKVVLASTGREAYAGGRFHWGAATNARHYAHTVRVDGAGSPKAHRQSASSPSSKDNQGGKRAGASDAHPNRRERGDIPRRNIINETSLRVGARRRPVARDRRD